jgi:uracil phosphoribosyltransferase
LRFVNTVRTPIIMTTDLHSHPLAQHYLSILRERATQAADFRRASAAITRLLVMEAAKRLELQACQVQTPLEASAGARIALPVVFVPILRAGLGMLDVSMELIPHSSVGYIGLERDEATAEANCYYAKMPDLQAAKHVFLLDPMLATGGSALHAIERLKDLGAQRISMVCIIAAPEGVQALQRGHADVDIIAGVIDRELDANKYIRPGLGDFGDRLFGT